MFIIFFRAVLNELSYYWIVLVLPVINSLDPEVVENGTEENSDQATGQVDGDQTRISTWQLDLVL